MRVLIVEDEHRIATTLKKGLEQERYAVDITFNGTDGYDLASTEEYDIILLDSMLPGMDGITFCTELRAHHIHTPILMLTAKSQIKDKITGLDAGADDYLSKPFAFEELLARIRALVRRPKQSLSTILTVDSLTLDTATFSVTRNGQPIKVSSKEYALLEYMMRHSGTILTKDQIISHVWDFDADVLPNTVEVYIKNLRTKIDAPFPESKALITTVRGFGYRFES